ncbi:uncharacterized protein [Haliotis asinina]|uniref:uncharacterized protein n=1 Tax=Haliotis asinina TaxID=109174 RepID=UPI00353215B9
MKLTTVRTTLVCLVFLFCCNIYFLYSHSKMGFTRTDLTSDIIQGIANELIMFIDRNITGRSKRKSKRFDCFFGRKLSATARTHANNSKESSEMRAKMALFYDRLTQKEKEKSRDLIKVFSEGVPTNITYFLYAGALLGSYSHHGMIPWDDDLDIIVREKDKPLLLEFLQSLRPKYAHYTKWNMNWKLYHKKSPNAGSKAWKWPFLDIFFYSEKSSYIQDCRATHKKFNKSDVFPLIKRPFMGMMLPAPRHTRKVLESTYNIDLCVSNSYDHRLEIALPLKCVVKLPCRLLRDKYPFVTRKNADNKTVEILDDINIISTNKSSWNGGIYETKNAF